MKREDKIRMYQSTWGLFCLIVFLIVWILSSCSKVEDFPKTYQDIEIETVELFNNTEVEFFVKGGTTTFKSKKNIVVKKDSSLIITVLSSGYFEGYQVLKSDTGVIAENGYYANGKKTFRFE